MEGTEASELGESFASQALKSLDGVFRAPSRQPPYSRGHGDPY